MLQANDYADRIEILDCTLDTFSSSRFDLIAATQLNLILEMTDEFQTDSPANGVLLLSGLLAADRDTILNHLALKKFFLMEERMEQRVDRNRARRF